ncbi:UBP1-associated protein 2A [Argentina anserina]|uniref:UBP1-associated protein 2A n=1 Tax=Argentina anserina TaxID=57926 RepID=UPI0021768FB9|nr:UBP1-associated protein 2A [Potentilla anserina]XP_050376946.1 UBP1-associated protein 2A [Potentilla anserina]
MARKRKLDSNSTEASEPAKKQQPEPEPVVEEPKPQEPPPEEVVEEEVDEEEEEVEEEEEYEEEEEVEEEEPGVEYMQKTENETTAADPSQSGAGSEQNGRSGEDDEDEPIQDLLEPFSKDQLVTLLKEAAESHRDVADRIRKVADEDPIHRKIFVHGLGWDTTAETLTSVFTEYGEIEDCKAVCDKVSGKSKGYGFILFKTRSGARKALKQPQKKIGNRMTACQLASLGPAATPSAPGPAAVTAQAQQVSEYTQRKIYVSNVGADLDPQKLLMYFSRFGEIEEGPLGLDKATGRPKGFCLFVYKSSESAKRALEEPHKNFEGHILHCQKAIDGPKPMKSQHGNQHHHNRNKNSGGFGGGAPPVPGHMMAPGGAAGLGFNQGPASTQALNPALGQALALLATQGAGLNIFGTLGAPGVNPGVPGGTHGMPSGYGNQPSISPGMIGTYGNQAALPGGYPNPQLGQGGSGRGPHGLGQYGGAPYTGH